MKYLVLWEKILAIDWMISEYVLIKKLFKIYPKVYVLWLNFMSYINLLLDTTLNKQMHCWAVTNTIAKFKITLQYLLS